MSRTYVVGLPVAITVDDDGDVSYAVDVSEAGEAVRELDLQFVDEAPTEEVRLADMERVEANAMARAQTFGWSSDPTKPTG